MKEACIIKVLYDKMAEQYLYRGRKYEVIITKTQTPGIEVWRRVDGDWDVWAALYYSNEADYKNKVVDKSNAKNWKYRQYDDPIISIRLENPLDANKFMKKRLLTAEMIEQLEAYMVAYKLNRQSVKGYNHFKLQGTVFLPPELVATKSIEVKFKIMNIKE